MGDRPGTAPVSVKKAQRQYYLEPIIAFYLFFAANSLSALYAPIQDCDEVYNYWEPTHYLRHGYGMQTWEYSPEYAIRSWYYIALHAIIGRLGSFLLGSKSSEFYFTRILLGILCALCETRLYTVVSRTLNARIGVFFLVIMTSSPGMFHASTAYLPSSFAMYMVMLGMASFMDWRGGLRTNNGIFAFGTGAVLGWPFAAALVIPYLTEELILANLSNQLADTLHRFLDGIARTSLLSLSQLAVDTYFFRGVQLVPFNIIWYNIFSVGPNIFGTEPWHFYFRNLAINFNFWFILALLSFPIMAAQFYLKIQTPSKQNTLRGMVFISPFYLWLGVFSLQPHKEERFMFPAYPALALNAAMALHMLLAYFGSTDPKRIVSMIPPQLKLIIVIAAVMAAIDLGILRILAMTSAYSAPLQVFGSLSKLNISSSEDILCLGKEWYRFTSSYFLPGFMRAHFIRSEFNGLLPGHFNEIKEGFGFWPGTHLIPAGMNNLNVEDDGKYIDVTHCNFLVDSYFPGSNASAKEPHYVLDTKNWEVVTCKPFLDASRTSLVGRTLWLPRSKLVPERHRPYWGELCLLRRSSRH